MFQGPEGLLPFPGKQLRDGAARRLDHQGVGVHQRAAQPLGQGPAHGGLAAAGHTDEKQIPGLPLHLGGNLLHPAIRDGGVQKALRRRLGLGHQHPQSVGPAQPSLLRLEEQPGAGGVIDEVKDPL